MNGMAVNTSMVVAWHFDETDKLCVNRVLDRRIEEHVSRLRRSRDDVAGIGP